MTRYSFEIVCDLHVPDHLIERYSDFPPIFKNVGIGVKDDIGSHMQEYCELIGRTRGRQLSDFEHIWARFGDPDTII